MGLPLAPEGAGAAVEAFTKPSAHPHGMRWPALAQAPAFRAPGGAASTQEEPGRRKRTTPHHDAGTHTLTAATPGHEHPRNDTPEPDPTTTNQTRNTEPHDNQLPAPAGTEDRRTSRRNEGISRGISAVGPLVFPAVGTRGDRDARRNDAPRLFSSTKPTPAAPTPTSCAPSPTQAPTPATSSHTRPGRAKQRLRRATSGMDDGEGCGLWVVVGQLGSSPRTSPGGLPDAGQHVKTKSMS